MPDHTTAASTATAPHAGAIESTIEAYVATWNETDPARRRAGIARAWAEAGRYRDPVMASDGYAGMVDFCALAPDGRLVEVVGFIDKM